MNLYVTFLDTDSLPVFADQIFPETEIKEQWENGNRAMIIWSLPEGAIFTQVAYLNKVLRMDTSAFVDALPEASAFGLNVPCVQN